MQKRIQIESNITNLRIVEKTIDEISCELGVNKDNYGKILVSTLEAVNNAIIHGNKSETKKLVKIEISYEKKILTIAITDEGSGFKPMEVPDPTKLENIENLHGRGIFLMSKLADYIKFNKKGNRVKMSFKDIKN